MSFSSPTSKPWQSLLLLSLFLVNASYGQTIIDITSGGDAGPTSGTNWSLSGTTLTATGTANIQASVIETALASGNLTVVSGTGSEFIIQVNEAIDYTGVTERTLTFGATHRVLLYQNITSTSAPLNIILASEFDRSSGFTGGGYGVGVFSTITTNGGDVWIGGGQLTGSWNGHTVGVGAAMGGGDANGVGAEISNATIGTNGGDVRILGTSNGLPGINAYWGNSTINAGAGNIELISDRMGFDFGGSTGEIQIDGTGTLTIAPLESSFANAVTWDGTLSSGYYTSTGGANTIDGLKIKNTMGLIIGKAGNSAPLTIASDIVINGPIYFESGSFTINSSVDLESTAAGADIVVKVNDYTPGPNATDGYISFQGDNITTNGGDIILWANASNRSSGSANNEIWLQGSNTLTSNGGKIVLAGGLDDGGASSGLAGLTAGDGIPDGFAYRGNLNSSAVIIDDNVTLLSGGGDVIIRGQSGGTPPNQFPRSFGVWADAGFKLDAGTGTINIRGKSESESAIWLGTTESAGALSPIAITSASTAANAITIHGESTTNRHGFIANWDGSTGSHVLIESSGASGGGVSITGITNGANDGIILGQTASNESVQILSQAGDVSLISNAGLYIGNDAFLGNRKDGNAVNGITPSVQSSSADILIRANSFNVGSAINVSAAGTLTIEPYDNSFSSAYSTSGLTLGAALTGLTIGKSTNTADVTVGSATTITGPITVYGGDIAVNENLNTTAGGALGDILLKGSGNIIQALSKSFTTSGGDVTLWADSDGSGTGYIQLTGGANSGIVSGGGNVTLGGGADLATGYARGAAVTDSDPNLTYYIAGVHLREDTEINSGGGNITLRGQNVGNSDGYVQPGIMGISTTLNAGTGKIALYGLAGGSGSANAQAISNSGSGWTIRSASTEADAITLIGDATTTINAVTSLGINFLGIIEATGIGGGIVLTGTSGTTTGYGDGLDIVGDVLAASGTITITGTDDATNTNNRDVFINNATLGFKTGTNVTSSTANVVVRGNRPAFGSNVAVNTSGNFTLEPAGDDFTSAITYPITGLTLDAAVSGLTIGKASSADGTSDVAITIGSAISIAGPITVYGGDITLNSDLTATALNADILLKASGNISTASSRTITTNKGDIIFWGDSNANNAGSISIGASNTLNSADGSSASGLSGGGDIVLAGGSDTSGDGVPAGYAISSNAPGVRIQGGATLRSGGGNITIRGKSTKSTSGWDAVGLRQEGNLVIDLGTGRIVLAGQSDEAYGIEMQAGNGTWSDPGSGTISIQSAATTGTAISITGSGVGSYGVMLNYGRQKTIAATGSGGIEINGTTTSVTYAGEYSGSDPTRWGVFFGDNTSLLSASGAISVDGGTEGIRTRTGITLGRQTSSLVTTSTADIVLIGDKMQVDGAPGTSIATSGAVTLKSSSASFAGALTYPFSNLSLSADVSGLTIGKSTNTANIAMNSATSIAGPITLYGGTITTSDDLTTSNGGAISFHTDVAPVWSNTPSISADGPFELIPRSASFTADVNFPLSGATISSNGLTIGKSGNESNISFTGDYSTNGDIKLYGTTVDINSLTSGGSLTLEGSMTVDANNALVVQDEIANNGTITVEDGGSLVQNSTTGTNSNTGTGYTVKRNSGVLPDDSRFQYWSSPVQTATMGDIFPNSDPTDFYYYSPGTGWISQSSGANMTPGVGYITTGSIGLSNGSEMRTFTGAVNNEDISVTVNASGGDYILAGNPYPSAISVTNFLADNTDLYGTVYYWNHTTNPNTNGGQNYSSDYAAWNATGGTSGNLNKTPNGYISAMQSVFVQAQAPMSQLEFQNDQRVSDNNTQFFKNDTRERVWLSLEANNGDRNQILVARIAEATDGFDSRYDGAKFQGNPDLAFYSLLNQEKMAIQAVSQSASEQTIGLGLNSTLTGEMTIHLDSTQLWDANRPIYLWDAMLNQTTDLQAMDYTFQWNFAGESNDRFFLIFGASTVGEEELTSEADSWYWYQGDNQLHIAGATAERITLRNTQGQMVAQTNQKQSLNLAGVAQGVYTVEVQTNRGTSVKKVVIKN